MSQVSDASTYLTTSMQLQPQSLFRRLKTKLSPASIEDLVRFFIHSPLVTTDQALKAVDPENGRTNYDLYLAQSTTRDGYGEDEPAYRPALLVECTALPGPLDSLPVPAQDWMKTPEQARLHLDGIQDLGENSDMVNDWINYAMWMSINLTSATSRMVLLTPAVSANLDPKVTEQLKILQYVLEYFNWVSSVVSAYEVPLTAIFRAGLEHDWTGRAKGSKGKETKGEWAERVNWAIMLIYLCVIFNVVSPEDAHAGIAGCVEMAISKTPTHLVDAVNLESPSFFAAFNPVVDEETATYKDVYRVWFRNLQSIWKAAWTKARLDRDHLSRFTAGGSAHMIIDGQKNVRYLFRLAVYSVLLISLLSGFRRGKLGA